MEIVIELYTIAAQYFDLDVHYCTLITAVVIIFFIVIVIVAIIITLLTCYLVSKIRLTFIYIYTHIDTQSGFGVRVLYCLQNC